MKISLEKDIDALSNVKSRMPEVFAETAITHRPKIVTQNGKPIGVLTDIGNYGNSVSHRLGIRLFQQKAPF